MIALDSHPRPSRDVLKTPGFAWWYVDLVDTDGNGVVVILSFGVPFMPGTARAERNGSLTPCGERPSVNLVIYEDGEPAFYTLQEVEHAGWDDDDGDVVRFGRSLLRTTRHAGRLEVFLSLDIDVAGGASLTGTLTADLAAVQIDAAGQSPHGWRPLGVAGRGRATLSSGDDAWDITGRVYHDRNASSVPLGELGIDHWLWGRMPDGDGERIYYLVWPEEGQPIAWGLVIDADGRATRVDLDVSLEKKRRGWFAMRWWRRARLTAGGEPWLTVDFTTRVDDGPFYMRFLTRATTPDGTVLDGVAEAVRPDARDRWIEPLTHFAIRRNAGSSMWLPLFDGPRRTRWQRLLKWWIPRPAPVVGESREA